MRDIYFAGGCFWGVEELFRRFGNVETECGYANGNVENPSYRLVCTDTTGFAETVRVSYDPARTDLRALTELFFRVIDPTSVNRQGNDVGSQYRTGVYYVDEGDLPVLREVFSAVADEVGAPLATELEPLSNFYPAEEYHQDYLQKNPGGYCHIDFAALGKIG